MLNKMPLSPVIPYKCKGQPFISAGILIAVNGFSRTLSFVQADDQKRYDQAGCYLDEQGKKKNIRFGGSE
jgi:hypothetical protein